jgi:preprotein translocase subunit YajC
LTTLFAILARTTSTSPASQPGDVPWYAPLFGPNNFIWILLIMMVVMFIISSRSKKAEERKRTDMLGQLKKGDRVQTIGGILGTVVEARENEVIVKVDESTNAKIKFARSAIHRVLGEEGK